MEQDADDGGRVVNEAVLLGDAHLFAAAGAVVDAGFRVVEFPDDLVRGFGAGAADLGGDAGGLVAASAAASGHCSDTDEESQASHEGERSA